MKTQTIIILILLCSLAHVATTKGDAPARDYTMVNMDNGLTSTILDIGATSFTFRVEWSGKLEIPGDKWLFLMGKLDLASVWSFMTGIEVDPTQGEATIELPYNWLPWYHRGREKFEKKHFSMSLPPPQMTQGGMELPSLIM